MTTLTRRLLSTTLPLTRSPPKPPSLNLPLARTISSRRTMASSSNPPPPSSSSSKPKPKPKAQHSHDHAHEHSHSLFSTHSHAHDVPSPDALKAALTGGGDRGSRITLLGLASNVGLTGLKVFAGWRFNSASLLAEAGHSASDLLGDFVTLFCYNMSRKPPSKLFPFGLAKFDTAGMLAVSAILVMGSIGIGLHSYHLLSILPLPDSNILSHLPHLPTFLPSHAGHSHSDAVVDAAGILDPNAAWTALLSVVVKEWLYRVTKKVGDEEGSSVLVANALHHRSDAFTSFVALISILGSYFGLPILDPLGGIFVSLLLLTQSSKLAYSSSLSLLDASCPQDTLSQIRSSVEDMRLEAKTNDWRGVGEGVSGGEEGKEWGLKSVRGISVGGGARVEVELVWKRGQGVGLAEVERVGNGVKEVLEGEEGVREVKILTSEVDSLDDLSSEHDHRDHDHAHSHDESSPNGKDKSL